MSERGGHVDRDKPCVTEIQATEDAHSALFDGEDLPNLTMGRYDRGLSVILIPAIRKAHETIGAAGYHGLFEQDESGPEIRFPATGLTAQRVQVDGEEVDFAARVEAQEIDTRMPLVANYAGAMIRDDQRLLPIRGRA